MEEVAVPYNKAKILLVVAGCWVFVAIAIALMSAHPLTVESIQHSINALIVNGVACVVLVFFGGGSLLGVARFFSNRPGLVLNSDGILENASLFPIGLIPWTEISGLHLAKFNRQTLLVVWLDSPETFVARLQPVSRLLCRCNIELIETPVAFGTGTLQISAEELLRLCTEYLELHRQTSGNGAV